MADDCEEKIFEGDIGTHLIFNVWTCNKDVEPYVEEGVDISSAVAAGDKEIIFIRPGGEATPLEVDGTFFTDGTDFKLEHITVENDLFPYGDWEGQARVKLTNGKWATSIIEFEVFERLFTN